jgi:hypothetical protein
MEYHKYSLAKKGKSICPKCERRTFVLYIDNTTGEPLHSTVGKCDRADNCGYHYSPKQYFTDNNISFDKNIAGAPRMKPTPKPQPSYIDTDVFKKSLQGYENNRLIQYLCGIVGDEATRQAIERYFIGTSKNGGTVFWQIDVAGKIRTGKVIRYAADGHRRKDVMPPVGWVHTTLKLPDFILIQCLFGKHLLRDATKIVAIVESEKTALIASVYLPQFLWLACGGSEGLNIDKCRCLKGRDVVLYPDIKQFDKWKEKAKELRKICSRVEVSDLLEKAATETERQAGFDLADYLVRFSPSEFAGQKQLDTTPSKVTPLVPEQGKQYPAYVSDTGILYIPTPPDGKTQYTVYSSVEAYNKRSEIPNIVWQKETPLNIAAMKQVFINLKTLTI